MRRKRFNIDHKYFQPTIKYQSISLEKKKSEQHKIHSWGEWNQLMNQLKECKKIDKVNRKQRAYHYKYKKKRRQ